MPKPEHEIELVNSDRSCRVTFSWPKGMADEMAVRQYLQIMVEKATQEAKQLAMKIGVDRPFMGYIDVKPIEGSAEHAREGEAKWQALLVAEYHAPASDTYSGKTPEAAVSALLDAFDKPPSAFDHLVRQVWLALPRTDPREEGVRKALRQVLLLDEDQNG